jgi:SAM-dependent methyltransferase
MSEVNLLRKYPVSKRSISSRASAKTDDHIGISRQFGVDYFDGPREYGYGGYRYDGRWVVIAQDMIEHWGLKPGMRVLDVGCAKGFLVKDFMKACPGLECFGLDISEYAVKNCEPEVVGRLHIGNMVKLPFPDNSFDGAGCLNTAHHLEHGEGVNGIRELQRVAKNGNAYIQVDSYRTPEERDIFVDWVLTAYTHDYPDGWRSIFSEAGYTGDYYWTFINN